MQMTHLLNVVIKLATNYCTGRWSDYHCIVMRQITDGQRMNCLLSVLGRATGTHTACRLSCKIYCKIFYTVNKDFGPVFSLQ
jgi:hypothetical protein